MKTEDDGKGKVKKTRGCFLVFGALFVSFLCASIYLPSYLSYRERKQYEKSIKYSHIIQASLLKHAKNASCRCYPKKIERYDELREIVSQYEHSFPKNFEDSGFKNFAYTSKEGTDFYLVIEIDDESRYREKFVIITPIKFSLVKNAPNNQGNKIR